VKSLKVASAVSPYDSGALIYKYLFVFGILSFLIIPKFSISLNLFEIVPVESCVKSCSYYILIIIIITIVVFFAWLIIAREMARLSVKLNRFISIFLIFY